MSRRRKAKIKFYASRIKHGRDTLDTIPQTFKTEVEEFMKTDEYLLM